MGSSEVRLRPKVLSPKASGILRGRESFLPQWQEVRVGNHRADIKAWWCAKKPLYFDLGSKLLEVRKLRRNTPCRGWGHYVEYDDFVRQFSTPRNGSELCQHCKMIFPSSHVISTGLREYYQMDLDPDTRLCIDCIEEIRSSRLPDNPKLWDAYTPLEARY